MSALRRLRILPNPDPVARQHDLEERVAAVEMIIVKFDDLEERVVKLEEAQEEIDKS